MLCALCGKKVKGETIPCSANGAVVVPAEFNMEVKSPTFGKLVFCKNCHKGKLSYGKMLYHYMKKRQFNETHITQTKNEFEYNGR